MRGRSASTGSITTPGERHSATPPDEDFSLLIAQKGPPPTKPRPPKKVRVMLIHAGLYKGISERPVLWPLFLPVLCRCQFFPPILSLNDLHLQSPAGQRWMLIVDTLLKHPWKKGMLDGLGLGCCLTLEYGQVHTVNLSNWYCHLGLYTSCRIILVETNHCACMHKYLVT